MRPDTLILNGHNGNHVAAAVRAVVDPVAPRHPLGLPAALADEEVDYATVNTLYKQAKAEWTAFMRDNSEVTDERRRAEAERIVTRVVGGWIDSQYRQRTVTDGEETRMVDAVLAELVGLGRLQPLLDDPNLSNITILGYDQVQLHYRDGRRVLGRPVANSDEHLVELIQNLARRATESGSTERSLSAAKPLLDMRLPDGSRLTVVIEVSQRPVVVIRRHGNLAVTLDDLVGPEFNMIDPLVRDFLIAAVDAGLNVVWTGRPNTGKTTIMRAAASALDPMEWFVTLEQSRELGLHSTGAHPWAVSLEAREGHGERGADGRPIGELSVMDLFPWTLRLTTPRVWIGEVRDGEMLATLQALSTTVGSHCTLHCREPAFVLDRMVDLAMQATGESSADRIYRQVAGVVDLIVYVEMIDERKVGGKQHRFVSHIYEVNGINDDGKSVRTTEVFGPGADGRAVPKFLPERFMTRLRRVGWQPQPVIDHQGVGRWPRPMNLVVQP